MPAPQVRYAPYWSQLILGRFISQAGLTTVADTSVAKTFAAALGQCLEELSVSLDQMQQLFDVSQCYGDDLDRRIADILPGDERRAVAQAASGTITLSRAQTVGAVTLVQGAQVKDALGNAFATVNAATIPDGQGTLANVPVIAQLPGAAGNVAANTITLFANAPSGIDTVTNPAALTGGTDAESDDALKARTYTYVAALSGGTAEAIVNRVLNRTDPATLDTIVLANFEDDPTTPGRGILYISDASGGNEARTTPVTGEVMTAQLAGPPAGTAQGGETRLQLVNWPVDPNTQVLIARDLGVLTEGTDYVCERSTGQVVLTQPLATGDVVTASYAYYTGIIQLAQRITNGYPADFSVERGTKPAGSFVTVQPPSVILVDVQFSLATKPNYLAGAVSTQVVANLTTLMQALGIGQNLYRSAIIAAAYDTPGVENFTLLTPAADVLTGSGQLVRPGNVVSQ